MATISAVKGIITGAVKLASQTVSPRGMQAVESVFAQGVKTASQVAETTSGIFTNKFFKTVQMDMESSILADTQKAMKTFSDDVLGFMAEKSSKEIPPKKLLKKIHEKLIEPFFLKLDRKTVDRLNGLSDEEFLSESINFIFNNYAIRGQKIPKELMPTVIKQNLAPGMVMAYDTTANMLIINEAQKLKNRAYIFGLLKHEFTHMWQALDVFRTKSLGEKFSRVLSQKSAKVACDQIRATAQLPADEFAKLATHPNFAIMQQYRQYLASVPATAEQFINTIQQNTETAFRNALEQRRIFVVNTMGRLAENTERGRAAKLNFRYFKNGSSGEISSSADKFKSYYEQHAEKEAFQQTTIGIAEYLFPELNLMGA